MGGTSSINYTLNEKEEEIKTSPLMLVMREHLY